MADAHFAAKVFQRAKSCDAAKSVTRAPLRHPSQLYSGLVMTHTILASIRFLSLSAVIVSGLPLYAADEIQVHWNEVCRAAAGNRLTIKTVNGDTVDGYCLSINVDEIAVTTKDQQVVRVAVGCGGHLQQPLGGHRLCQGTPVLWLLYWDRLQ
jgi:hypothetical protein